MAYWMNKKPCWEIKNCSPEKKKTVRRFITRPSPVGQWAGGMEGRATTPKNVKDARYICNMVKGGPFWYMLMKKQMPEVSGTFCILAHKIKKSKV